MHSRSLPNPGALVLAGKLAACGRYLMGTINNESTEINQYRIEQFRLKEIFDLFVSSCFVGLRKPERDIYRLALEITQRAPEECCFIDDRALNLEQAASLGIHTIQMQGVEQLREELEKVGVVGG
jgi:putative hydrolase of the HAD superfamily